MSRLARWSLNAAYASAIALASPAIAWSAWRAGKYREGYAEKLLGRVPVRTGDRSCVWLHAVSVGEVNLVGVLIAELRQRHPDWEVVVSTTTKTGYDLAQKKYGAAHTVFYCPLDFSWAVEEAMRRVRPDLLLLAELELWPNLIEAAKRHGAKVAIVNGRLSENSYNGYRRVRPLVKQALRSVDLLAIQDIPTRERFIDLGARRRCTQVTGSLKYDGAETNRGNARTRELKRLAGFATTETVWLAGSTQAPEEAICLRVFREAFEEHPELRLVLVPRHPERFEEVARLLNESGLDWKRRSQLSPSSLAPSSSILLVDSVGELGAWWGTADLGFVGGSFGSRGGQNMIEPAAYGVATCFGPNTKNFRDIVATLLNADGARMVENEAALEAFVNACLEMPEEAKALGERARALVTTQLGATARTADAIDKLMGVAAATRQRMAA